MKNESILDEKAALKDIQIYCILVTYLILNFIEKPPIDPLLIFLETLISL
jgi:hypothetical protein